MNRQSCKILFYVYVKHVLPNKRSIFIVLQLALIGLGYKLLTSYDIYKASANDKNIPVIFVGGVPRSGTTLMRAILDAHRSIRCGQETHILPNLLGMKMKWFGTNKTSDRLKNAGIDDELLNDAIRAFMLKIIIGHGRHADIYCNKDPLLLRHAIYVSELLPNSKFILMIRDGRANAHSIISRRVSIYGWDINSFETCLDKWNKNIEHMFSQCISLGETICIPVYYEQLVLHPEKELRKILKFLAIEWDDAVLNHENYIGNKIELSKTEISTDQVIKPINLEGLDKWVGHIPDDVLKNIDSIAPMLSKLGYDTKSERPNYGKADAKIEENTRLIQKNQEYWHNLAHNYSVHADRFQK
jgi:protein-tyrosine sulfotransferase